MEAVEIIGWIVLVFGALNLIGVPFSIARDIKGQPAKEPESIALAGGLGLVQIVISLAAIVGGWRLMSMQ